MPISLELAKLLIWLIMASLAQETPTLYEDGSHDIYGCVLPSMGCTITPDDPAYWVFASDSVSEIQDIPWEDFPGMLWVYSLAQASEEPPLPTFTDHPSPN